MITNFQTYSDFVSDDDNASAVQAACATDYEYTDGTKIDEDGSILASLILKRYKYRRIGWTDPEKFLYYFTNNIETYKDQYMNLLHNQPGFADYDFTVQTYREKQNKIKLSRTGKTQQGVSEDIINTSENTTNNLQHGEIIDRTKTGGKTTTNGGTDTKNHTGGYKDTNIEGTHKSEYSPHVSRVTQNGGHKSAWSGNQTIKAELPMQEGSYSTFTEAAELEDGKTPETQEGYFSSRAKAGMPIKLDNSAATAQGQDYHNEYGVDKSSVTESYKYDDDNNGDITVQNGDSANPDITTREYTGESEETIHGKTISENYNGYAEKDSHSGEDITTGTKIGTKHDTHTHGDVDTTGSEENTEREIWTGRDLDLATLLTRAQAFIQKSSAWVWYRQKLDSCFLSNVEE